jgi:uncharacterized metal-binding protein
MAEKNPYKNLPLVYSCSGCSSAAQVTNSLAVLLDRQKMAEMSCIAGVGGGVRSLLKVARSDRSKIVLDGCPLHCAKSCLKQNGIEPDLHIDLSKEGVRKEMHEDPDFEEVEEIWKTVIVPRVTALVE